MIVPECRVGPNGDLCPRCGRRIPSEALDGETYHLPECTWRQDVRRQRNLRNYGISEPLDVENGHGKVRLTVTYELNVDFVGEGALSEQLEWDFTNPNRTIPLSSLGGMVTWKRGEATIDDMEWVEKVHPQPRRKFRRPIITSTVPRLTPAKVEKQHGTDEWRAWFGGRAYDRLFMVQYGGMEFMSSPANRLEPEEVGVPVFDY